MTRPKLEPRFANRRQLRIAGVGVHYAEQSSDAFAKQWERFTPSIGKVPGQVGSDAYGVVTGSFGGAHGFEYITGGRTDASMEGGDRPDFFERYGKDFNPQTASGKVEIWVPLKR